MKRAAGTSLLRTGDAAGQVTTIELFFDLVYVFAVTQLSHLLVERTTLDGAVQAAVLLAMVWQVWIYTTWATNYVDPRRQSVRMMLIALMMASLVLASALPGAFEDRGALVAATYVAMQFGRCLFMLYALRGEVLLASFQRILPWTAISSAVVIVGVVACHGHAREALWAGAVTIDIVGAAFGFYVPGMARSATSDWTVAGSHFAERCQALVLIALGESIVVTGTGLSTTRLDATTVTAFAVVFATSVLMWWLYFDRAAEGSARTITESDDPGRLARDGFHWIHPVIVAGIIATAASDDEVLAHPDLGAAHAHWLVLGGPALFLAGHAMFKAVVWRIVPVSRLAGVAALAMLLLVADHVSALALAALALAVVVGVAIADRLQHPPGEPV